MPAYFLFISHKRHPKTLNHVHLCGVYITTAGTCACNNWQGNQDSDNFSLRRSSTTSLFGKTVIPNNIQVPGGSVLQLVQLQHNVE